MTLLTFKTAVGFLGFPYKHSDALRWQAIVDLIFVLNVTFVQDLQGFSPPHPPRDFKIVETAKMC